MGDKKLTVAITTYNRRNALIEQLRSLERQGQFDKYSITIFNNKSNYNVEETLKSALSKDFMDIVSVYDRKYNVGGDCNIALTFLQTNTQWMWLLSDDDITTPTSLQTVLEDIEHHQDICWLKYSIAGAFEDKKVDNLVDVFKNGHKFGEFLFMSNNVYQLSLMKDYLGNIMNFICTSFSQCAVPLLYIKYAHGKMMFRSSAISTYGVGPISYKYHYVHLNFPNFIGSQIDLTREEIRAFKELANESPVGLLKSLFEVDNKYLRREFFKKYMGFYLWGNTRNKIIYYCLYWVFDLFNCKVNDIEYFYTKIRHPFKR